MAMSSFVSKNDAMKLLSMLYQVFYTNYYQCFIFADFRSLHTSNEMYV